MAVRILPFPVPKDDIARLEVVQSEHSAAVNAGDVLAVYNCNIRFHRELLGLCGNACLIETIEHLAQKCRASAPTRMPIRHRWTIRGGTMSR